VFAPFLIILIIILLLSFFHQKFVRHISRRCLDQTLWKLVGISYAMWSCGFKGWFFQNGCRWAQNVSQTLFGGHNYRIRIILLRKTFFCESDKIYIFKFIAGYSPNRNWWNLIGTSTSSGTR
jgi:hypothetical protein